MYRGALASTNMEHHIPVFSEGNRRKGTFFWFHTCSGERSPSREHSGVYGIALGLSHIRTCYSWPEDALGTSVGF